MATTIKMENKIKYILKVFLALFLFIPIVSSQIIGGDIYFEGNLDPSWQEVFVYNTEDTGEYAEIQVSPDKYRYSKLNAMPGSIKKIFSTNGIVRAEILDFENGFAAGPVDIKITDEEYNIFQTMEFREVIQVKKPTSKLIVSPDHTFNLTLNTFDDCDLYFNSTSLCPGGCDYRNTFDANLGQNNFEFILDCYTGERTKVSSQELFKADSEKWINYEKELSLISPEDSIYKINFYGTSSENDLPITDFIPTEFEVFNISDNGNTFVEDGYSSIEWKDINNTNFNFTYYIKPANKLRTCDFGVYEDEKINLRNSFESVANNLSRNLNLKNNEFFFECNFSKDVNFQMIESFEFTSTLENKIKNNQKSNIELKGILSNSIENLELKEYVPKDFTVTDISNNGILDSSTANYNVIIWKVSNDNFNVKYSVTPETTGDYETITELENNELGRTQATVYSYIAPIIPSKGGGSSGGSSGSNSNHYGQNKTHKYEPKNFSRVFPNRPIIKEIEDVRVAFYSKFFKESAAFDLFKLDFSGYYDRRLTYIKSFSIETNMNSSEKGNMKFEYTVNKSFLSDNNYKDIKFKTRKNKKFFTITGGVISSTDSTITYGFETPTAISEFFIFAEKSKLNTRDKIMIIIEKIINYIYSLKNSA